MKKESNTLTGAQARSVANSVHPVPYESHWAQVNNIRLNYLDWGGKGPNLVLLHGILDSPHIFEDLAIILKKQYRVVAYARRGHGHSDAPEGPYDLDTLVEDLRQLMDYLDIRKAHLLGWSMGGNEITRFAGLYPDRVEKLIYLESGYDWTDPEFLKGFAKGLQAVIPNSNDLRSIDAYKNWYHNAWHGKENAWTQGLDAYIRDITRIDNRGRVTSVPDEKIFKALFQSLASPPRDYTRVKAPVLALYATRFFPADAGKPEISRQLTDWEKSFMGSFRVASINRLQRELSSEEVHQLNNTTHMSIGVHQPETLATLIRKFLKDPINAP